MSPFSRLQLERGDASRRICSLPSLVPTHLSSGAQFYTITMYIIVMSLAPYGSQPFIPLCACGLPLMLVQDVLQHVTPWLQLTIM